MDRHSGIKTAEAPVLKARQAAQESQPVGVGPATVLLLTAWVGLVAGFLDLGIMAANRLIDGEFYRLSGHFVWIIPAGVTVLLLVPGMVLALIARLRHAGLRISLVIGLLSFVGFLDLSARLPLELWASLLLSGGLAVQWARLAVRRRGGFLRFVRWTTAPLVVTFMAIALVTAGGNLLSERRVIATLPPPPAAAKNLLLIVWDTARAGNLSLHGYKRRTTPNLERLAGRGAKFDLAFATSSWTLPSHASLFTGRWPHELEVDWKSPLGNGPSTLAEYLAARGYDTAGFVANLDYCGREFGLARGFAHYEDYPLDLWDIFTRYVALGRRMELVTWACALNSLVEKTTGRPQNLVPSSREHAKDGLEIDRTFLGWLTWQRPRNRPFFAFLNYNDAHSPYEVPDLSTPGFGLRPTSYRDRLVLQQWLGLDKSRLSYHDVQLANDVYDDSIAYLDRRLGAVLSALERRGVLENTLVIVTSDHGEHLGDHLLFFHGCSLYRQLIQVPLVIVDPARVPQGHVIAEPVSLRDVPATAVDLLGLEQGAPFPGRSLARCWRRQHDPVASTTDEPLLIETGKPLVMINEGREPVAKGPMKSLVDWGMHYIRAGDGTEELYYLPSDPEERINGAGLPGAQEIIQRFRSRLRSILKER
jgi:arylsulfatase A-like enzyme